MLTRCTTTKSKQSGDTHQTIAPGKERADGWLGKATCPTQPKSSSSLWRAQITMRGIVWSFYSIAEYSSAVIFLCKWTRTWMRTLTLHVGTKMRVLPTKRTLPGSFRKRKRNKTLMLIKSGRRTAQERYCQKQSWLGGAVAHCQHKSQSIFDSRQRYITRWKFTNTSPSSCNAPRTKPFIYVTLPGQKSTKKKWVLVYIGIHAIIIENNLTNEAHPESAT